MDRYFYDPLQENLDRLFKEQAEYANEFEWKYQDRPLLSPCEPKASRFELADAVALAWKYNAVQTRRHQAKRKAALKKQLERY